MVNDPESTLNTLTESMENFLPGDVTGLLTDYTDHTLRGAGSSVLFLGALAALWSGSSASYALIKVPKRVYGLRETRPAWKVWDISVLMVLCLVLLVGVQALVILAPRREATYKGSPGCPVPF